MNKYRRLGVAQTPTHVPQPEGLRPWRRYQKTGEYRWGIGRQQPNSRTAICSCVQGGTGALTRAPQIDLQQVTHVHVPVPQRPCVYKHDAEQFDSATDCSRFILGTSFSTPEPNRASARPTQDQEEMPQHTSTVSSEASFYDYPAMGGCCLSYLDPGFKKEIFIIALWWSELF